MFIAANTSLGLGGGHCHTAASPPELRAGVRCSEPPPRAQEGMLWSDSGCSATRGMGLPHPRVAGRPLSGRSGFFQARGMANMRPSLRKGSSGLAATCPKTGACVRSMFDCVFGGGACWRGGLAFRGAEAFWGKPQGAPSPEAPPPDRVPVSYGSSI